MLTLVSCGKESLNEATPGCKNIYSYWQTSNGSGIALNRLEFFGEIEATGFAVESDGTIHDCTFRVIHREGDEETGVITINPVFPSEAECGNIGIKTGDHTYNYSCNKLYTNSGPNDLELK